MSIRTMAVYGAARNLRKPTKSDAGLATSEASDAGESPTLTDLLAKSVPVGLVTGYTAFIAVVSEWVEKPTAAEPNPNRFLPPRWIALVVLVAAAAALTWVSYYRRAGRRARPPYLEMAAVTVAAGGWGLAVPESPFLAQIQPPAGAIYAALIAFAGVAINLVIAAALKKQAKR